MLMHFLRPSSRALLCFSFVLGLHNIVLYRPGFSKTIPYLLINRYKEVMILKNLELQFTAKFKNFSNLNSFIKDMATDRLLITVTSGVAKQCLVWIPDNQLGQNWAKLLLKCRKCPFRNSRIQKLPGGCVSAPSRKLILGHQAPR